MILKFTIISIFKHNILIENLLYWKSDPVSYNEYNLMILYLLI